MMNLEKWYTMKFYRANGRVYVKDEISAQSIEELKARAQENGIPYDEKSVVIEWIDTVD